MPPMNTLSTLTTKCRELLQYGPGEGDERTKGLFLMSSFWNVVAIVVVYNILIYWVGPKFMETYKEPWDTYSYLVWHNLFLVATNALFGTALFALLMYTRQNLLCQPVGKADIYDDVIAYLLYSLLLLKIFELIDALTLVAKKLEPPFILVFHHTTIVAIVWVSVKFGPGGSAIFPTLLNSWVHVLIYLHFKFSRHYMSQHQSRRTFILIYFVQFVVVTLLSGTTMLYGCGYPEWVAFLSVTYNVILMLVYARSMWTLWCSAPPPGDEDISTSESSDDDDANDCPKHNSRGSKSNNNVSRPSNSSHKTKSNSNNSKEENKDKEDKDKDQGQGQIEKVKAIHDHIKKEKEE